MAKYYRLWIADLEAKTNALSNAQFGIYWRMLNYCYTHEKGISDDPATLARIARCANESEEQDAALVLNTFFDLGEDGIWRNKKTETTLAQMRAYREAQTVRSLLGVAARQAQPAAKAPRANGHRIADFGEFWALYPRKVGKGAAERAWKAAKPDAELLPVILSAVREQSQSEQWHRDAGQYIPHPATWLNQKRWLDEAAAAPDSAPRKLVL